MKCWNCHHLNNASDAECFMCGAVLYNGTPKVHGSLYAFLALCVFLPVFAVAGGTNKVLPLFGVTPPTVSASQGVKVRVDPVPVYRGRVASNGPIFIPVVLGMLGVGACLSITRMPFGLKTQSILSGLVVLTCWTAYLLAAVELAKDTTDHHPVALRA